MLHTVDILARGLAMPPLDKPPVPVNTHCALTGRAISEGYPVWEIVPNSAGEFLELLPGGTHGYLCDNAARCFKNTWNLGNRLIFEDGTHYYPLVDAAAAAKQDRPCWSQLLRQVAGERVGERYVCILTTDFKKRLWPLARVGTVGQTGTLYVYDSDRGIAANLTVDWANLIACLDTIERIYRAGYPKPCLETSLYSDLKTCERVGWSQVAAYENQLAALRGTAEFSVSILIAQKGEN